MARSAEEEKDSERQKITDAQAVHQKEVELKAAAATKSVRRKEEGGEEANQCRVCNILCGQK